MNTPIGFKERLGAELAALERARADRTEQTPTSRHETQARARRVFAQPGVRRTVLAGLAAGAAATIFATTGGMEPQNRPANADTVAQVLDAAAVNASKGPGQEPGLRQWIYTDTVTCEPACGHLTSWIRYDGQQGASVGKAFETKGRTAVLVNELPDFLKQGRVGEEPRETWQVLSQLPTEPRELLARVSEDPFFDGGLDPSSPPTRGGRDNRHDFMEERPPAATPGARFSRILNILQTAPNIPPEINAALYRALALIPGTELVGTSMRDAADRPSLAIAFDFHDRLRTREYLYLDPQTYAYRGYRMDWNGERRFSNSYARASTGVVDHPGQVPGGPAPDPSNIVKMTPPIMAPLTKKH
ncbi:CU044_5270 family protein [Streptomyces sp. MBT42]|uniref:CU044_5270 family protein n=1 Tax=Streptomyces sp. MBT42 TaxID=1488373 RepID=UPI001E3EF9E2|nr:CU044_5270 family protein [Streptomyces sp. MBT42]MCD2462025.1 CU044_5270 family protein [Streptomyces sp. MBT42]